MYLKPLCYFTKATLSPQKSQKNEIYHTAGKMEISDFSDILATLGPNGVWMIKRQVPGRKDKSVSQAEDLFDKANSDETSEGEGNGERRKGKIIQIEHVFFTTLAVILSFSLLAELRKIVWWLGFVF